MKLLHIDSSILGSDSISRQLSQAVVEQWINAYPNVEVIYRDLNEQPPRHLSAEILQAGILQPSQLNSLQRKEAALSKQFIEEFLSANVLVLGAPMYNFSIPSQLKAWVDRVLVRGLTFKYTEQGPVGLAGNKSVIIASSRGNIYAESSANYTQDHQETYLKTILNFVGITDITVIRAEGLNINSAVREQALLSAQFHINQLTKNAA
ncbi:MAG: (Acyl-carrier-protein) phosphodiesterase [Gammaproteobacteria bacterium]|jgi:FMN-dependent NADH-azoreductase|nr:(Acyl-carrier-protein) phosphodiesterase [Gammaproteobacteria bacterium]